MSENTNLPENASRPEDVQSESISQVENVSQPKNSAPDVPQHEPVERFKNIIAVMIALVTTFIAIITFLQNDAAQRDDSANRDTKQYTMQALGMRVRGNAVANYDYYNAYQTYNELRTLGDSATTLEDKDAAQRYNKLRDEVVKYSDLLSPKYFDPQQQDEPDIARYEADTYLVETTRLTENFLAASAVKDLWDYKGNTYIIHLTLLAVALFLFGMSITVANGLTRWLFSSLGTVITIVALVWAVKVYTEPVTDLRQCKTPDSISAINAYAEGVGLSYQKKYNDALKHFDEALQCSPNYINALVARGQANEDLSNYAAAIADYEKAVSLGNNTPRVLGSIGWNYYLLGRFTDAIKMYEASIAAGNPDLWMYFDMATSQLAEDQVDAAKATFKKGMDIATQQVVQAKEAGKEPSSDLWWSLDEASQLLEQLLTNLETGKGDPSSKSIRNPQGLKESAGPIIADIRSLSVALEYTGKPPEGTLQAKVSPFRFSEAVYDDQGEITDYKESDSFVYGLDEISVLFDYEGIKIGDEVVFKVFIDGEEDPSWRLVDKWALESSGTAEKLLSFAYSNVHVLSPGEYTVDLYINSHLAQTGYFTIEPEK